MEPSAEGRCGEIASDISIILVTVAQLIFFTSFQKYIAWPITEADGSVTWQSMLADGYSTWLPFPIAASIVVILASVIMIVYNRTWFRQGAWVLFCLLGMAVTVSLVLIFPFDFSVIPHAIAVDVVPIVVRAFFIAMAVFYGVCALVLIRRWRRHMAEQATS